MIEQTPLHGGQLRRISERFQIPSARLLDFSANINPDGPPARLLSTLRIALEDISNLTSYPDLEEFHLKQCIAAYAGVNPANLIVANGFIPLLDAVLQKYKLKRCLLPVPAFVEYRRSLARAGVEVVPHLLTPETDFSYDFNALVQGGHDSVLLANPQNPSGVLASRDALLGFVSRCAGKNVTVLLDEAFIDYSPLDSLAADAERFPNLFVFRSVTKFHAVPGLRIGYAAANEAIARAIHEDMPPWSITNLASVAIVSALSELGFVERTRMQNDARRTRMRVALNLSGIHTYPSAANFLLLRVPEGISAEHLWRHMITEHQLVLRDCSNFECLPLGHLRAAVRTDVDNERLIGALNRSMPLCRELRPPPVQK
ncbi:MAG TPA: aminotransferase class I/II-fold pyridoxal phosphate-dependent enzyme [Acidobacteriaceae bacterium]|nr:aminotransferase class I/II-fold pyridoxal phosphate-dependent enzyme [Acidobacteriaceae bacterium]